MFPSWAGMESDPTENEYFLTEILFERTDICHGQSRTHVRLL